MDQRDRVEDPIFIIDGDDLAAFSTLELAEQQVESPDVDDYEIYDALGRRLRFGPKTEPRGRWIKTVDVVPVQVMQIDDDPSHRDAFRSGLVRGLLAIEALPPRHDQLSLAKLVEIARDKTLHR